MILSIVTIILVGLIAYFHYLQGLLSGLISAVLALVATALQTMPFGPSIAGYTRYPLAGERERLAVVPAENRGQVDRTIIDQLKNDNIDKDSQSLLIPVDDLVLAFARHQSNAGALA